MQARQVVHQRPRLLGPPVEHEEPPSRHSHQRMRDRGAGTARAKEHHPVEIGARQRLLEAPAPSGSVGVVADKAPVPVDDRVDRADRAGLLGELVQQRHDRLLAGEGDIQASEAHDPRCRKQHRQRLRAAARTFQVDQLIVQAQAMASCLLLLHRGRERGADARTDQADKCLASWKPRYGHRCCVSCDVSCTIQLVHVNHQRRNFASSQKSQVQ